MLEEKSFTNLSQSVKKIVWEALRRRGEGRKKSKKKPPDSKAAGGFWRLGINLSLLALVLAQAPLQRQFCCCTQAE